MEHRIEVQDLLAAKSAQLTDAMNTNANLMAIVTKLEREVEALQAKVPVVEGG